MTYNFIHSQKQCDSNLQTLFLNRCQRMSGSPIIVHSVVQIFWSGRNFVLLGIGFCFVIVGNSFVYEPRAEQTLLWLKNISALLGIL